MGPGKLALRGSLQFRLNPLLLMREEFPLAETLTDNPLISLTCSCNRIKGKIGSIQHFRWKWLTSVSFVGVLIIYISDCDCNDSYELAACANASTPRVRALGSYAHRYLILIVSKFLLEILY